MGRGNNGFKLAFQQHCVKGIKVARSERDLVNLNRSRCRELPSQVAFSFPSDDTRNKRERERERERGLF